MKGIIPLVLISNSLLMLGCQNQKLFEDNRVMMGTFVEVKSPDKDAAGIVFKELKRIEDLLSKYKEDSEVSKLNTRGNLKVSSDTFYIIKKSLEFYKLSNGAFDITVAPLVSLWGFTDKKYSVPTQDEIREALKFVGSDKIILQDKDNVVKFSISGMKIDLGAIAKGYASDCAVAKLKEAGIKSCLVNVGGQIYCLGNKFNKPWKIAVKSPRRKGFNSQLELENKAVATSGDYEQYFIKDKKRYSHILNPKTGYPSDSGILSVTVVAPDGLTADALGTAIFVLGRDKGMELARKFSDVTLKIIEKKDVQNN